MDKPDLNNPGKRMVWGTQQNGCSIMETTVTKDGKPHVLWLVWRWRDRKIIRQWKANDEAAALALCESLKPKAPNPQVSAEIEKLRQNPQISGAQVNKILEVTQGNITGLKVARRLDSKTIFIVYQGRRYDIDQSGALARQERLGAANQNIIKVLARKLNCPLCGVTNEVPKNEIRIKCRRCGFPLRRVRVKIR